MRARLEKRLREDRLEEVAHLELLLGPRDLLGKGAGGVVAAARDFGLGCRHVRLRAPRPRQPHRSLGAPLRHREVVLQLPRGVGEDVDHQDVVGQVEDEVALVGIARLVALDVLELERQVVSEGAAQPQRGSSSCAKSAVSARTIEKIEFWRERSSSVKDASASLTVPPRASPPSLSVSESSAGHAQARRDRRHQHLPRRSVP